MEKENYIKNISEILNNLSHYKNKKSFITIIEKNTQKILGIENLLENLLEEIRKKAVTNNIESLVKLNKQLFSFIQKNKKEYIKKKNINGNVIYEYEDHFIWYVNKKNDIEKFYINTFSKKKIIEIKIDENIRSITDIKKLEEDIKMGKEIKITISKKYENPDI